MRSEREFLLDVLVRLKQAGVAYMLTGSMASNYWGTPRTTHDLEFVLLMRPDQVDPLLAAFGTDHFIQPHAIHAAFKPPYQFNVLDSQSALKADFWMAPRHPVRAFGVRPEITRSLVWGRGLDFNGRRHYLA